MKETFRQSLKRNKVVSSAYYKAIYLNRKMMCKISPEFTTKWLYKKTFKEELNLDNPKKFNEKLQWLKLNAFDEEVIKCADKYEMREYISKKQCDELMCNLYGVYTNVEDIDFDALPNKFVLKCTHGCGYNIVCTNKEELDILSVKKQLNQWMNEEFGYLSCELHYTKMKPRIICEEFLEDAEFDTLVDYKIYCFNGKPMYTLVCLDRGNDIKKIFYDLEWNKILFRKDNADLDIQQPSCYEDMIKYAKQLSEPFSFVRVDFYNVDNKPILGELTFTPAGGLSVEYTEEGEMKLGDLLKLPNSIGEN